MEKLIFKVHGSEYRTKELSNRQYFAGFLYALFGIKTRIFRETMSLCRKSWNEHASKLQEELDKERERGWGFRYLDGRRVDFK